MTPLRSLLVGAALLSSALPAMASEQIYYVGLDVSLAGQDRGTLHQRSLTGVTVGKAADGATRLRTRILWTEQRAGGEKQSTLDLDPEVGDARAMLTLLDGGFELNVAADGSSTGMRAVDQEAWRDTVTLQPEAAALINTEQQFTGLQPLPLPAHLALGQRITRRTPSRDFGELTTQLQVQKLTASEVVVSVALNGTGVQGRGRQVLQRADGIPIEARMQMTVEPRGGLAATEYRTYLARMDLDPLQRLEGDVAQDTYPAMIESQLSAPPFSAPSPDADAYRQPVQDERVPGLLDPAALKQTEASLRFAVNQDYSDGRPLIRIAGRVGNTASTHAPSDALAIAVAVPRAVRFFDAQGKRIPGMAAQPVLDQWVLIDDFHADEKDIGFPFRLALATRTSQLDAVRLMQLDVDVETHVRTDAETWAAGSGARPTPDSGVQWTSPTRVTVRQPLPVPGQVEGYWTSAVPLDAQGHPMPTALLGVDGPLAVADPHHDDPAQRLLRWERMGQPNRLEIATAAPIAALQLRHHYWRREPRQWTFRYLHPDAPAPPEARR